MGKRWPRGIGEIFDLYIKANEQFGLSEIKFLERALRCLVAAVGDIEDLSIVDAEQFQLYLVDSGMSGTEADACIKRVSRFFSWAVKQGFVEENPFEGLKLFKAACRKVEIFMPEGVEQGFEVYFDEVWDPVLMLGLMLIGRGEGLDVTVNGNDLHGKVLFMPAVAESVFARRWQEGGHEGGKQAVNPLRELSWAFYEILGGGQPFFDGYFLN